MNILRHPISCSTRGEHALGIFPKPRTVYQLCFDIRIVLVSFLLQIVCMFWFPSVYLQIPVRNNSFARPK